MSDTISKLKDLKELLDAGALTQDEFDEQKSLILEKSKITQVAPAPVVGQPGMMQTIMRCIPADWLAGSWTRPGDGCCKPTINGTVTPMGDNAFQFSATNFARRNVIYARDGGASGFGDTWTGQSDIPFKLTVLDENTFSIICAVQQDLVFFKDTKTSNKAKQVFAPVVEVMAGA